MQTKHMLTQAGLIGLALFGANALANEDKYPAYDFKPTVLYSNPELIAKAGSSAGGHASSMQAAVPAVEIDPKFPAAYFTPSVIYPSH
ncbi:MAG: hypothetical protein EHM62_00335 [Methylococcus sp.]|nr:MAG: hypothetical protein EHM62_00335 [Methylococcus sp.]